MNKRQRLQAALRAAKKTRYNTPLDTPKEHLSTYAQRLENMIRAIPENQRHRLEIEGRLGTLHKRRRRTEFKSGVTKTFFEKLKKVLTEHKPPIIKKRLDIYFDSNRDQIRVSLDPATNQILHCLVKKQKARVDIEVKGGYALRLTTALEIPVKGDAERKKTGQILQPVHPWWRIQCGAELAVSGEFKAIQGSPTPEIVQSLSWVMLDAPCLLSTIGDMLPMAPWNQQVPASIQLMNRAGGRSYESQYVIEVAPTQCRPRIPHGYAPAQVKPRLYRMKTRYRFELNSFISIDLTITQESRRHFEDILRPNASSVCEVEYEMDGERIPVLDPTEAAKTMLRDIRHIFYP